MDTGQLFPNRTKIVFMGTPAFSVATLKALIEEGYEVAAVYTQPPRPAGRGYALHPSPVQIYAEQRGIPVYSPISLKDPKEQEIFASHNADVAVVVAYGLLLPLPILNAYPKGCVNVHASLLPRWRGAAPIQRAIMAGDRETGITIMRMDEGLDTGPMLSEVRVTITPEMTTPILHDILANAGAQLLVDTLPAYLAGTLQGRSQPLEGVTYAHKIRKEEAQIQWDRPAVEIERRVRAFSPFPGAWFSHAGIRIKVLQAQVEEILTQGEGGQALDDRLAIQTTHGVLRPLVLQKAGGKALPLEEFLRGHSIPKGTLLGDTSDAL